MSDDTIKRGSPDDEQISLNQPHELAYWMNALHATEAELRAAVWHAGNSPDAVRQYLEKLGKS